MKETRQHFGRSASTISLMNGAGFVSALLVDIVIANKFGLGKTTDALFISLTFPQFITSILQVTVNVAFVPLFTKILIQEGKRGLWDIVSYLVNWSLLLFIPVGLIGSSVSFMIIFLLGAGLDESTKNLGIELSRLLFLLVIPMGAVEILRASLNSVKSFSSPAAVITIKNVSVLLIIFISPSLTIHTVARGYIIAAFAQFFFLWLVLITKGFHYKFGLGLRNEWVREARYQIRFPAVGEIISQSRTIAERFLASFLPIGIVSALGYAGRILRAVDSIFIGSITTVFLPSLSTEYANSHNEKYKETFVKLLKMICFVSLPISALIIGTSESIVKLLFERGEFTVNDTRTTALILSIYILSIPAWATFQALQASFYSIGDTKRPFSFKVGFFATNIILNFILFFTYGAAGLALALTLSRTIITVLSARLIHRRLKILDSSLMFFIIRIAFSSLLLGIVTFVLRGQFESLFFSTQYGNLIDILFRAVIGSFIFSLSLFILRVQEVFKLFQLIKSRLLV